MVTCSKTATYQKAQSVSYLPWTLVFANCTLQLVGASLEFGVKLFHNYMTMELKSSERENYCIILSGILVSHMFWCLVSPRPLGGH